MKDKTTKRIDPERYLTEAFAVAMGKSEPFNAQTIYDYIKDRLPVGKANKLVQRKMGVMFRRYNALGLIHQCGVTRSQRQNHDGKLCYQWAVGKEAKGERASTVR